MKFFKLFCDVYNIIREKEEIIFKLDYAIDSKVSGLEERPHIKKEYWKVTFQ